MVRRVSTRRTDEAPDDPVGPGEDCTPMRDPDCAICGMTVQENRVEVSAEWTTEPRHENHLLHERCANAVLGGWYTP